MKTDKIVIIITEDNREIWLKSFRQYVSEIENQQNLQEKQNNINVKFEIDQYPHISDFKDYQYAFVWKPNAGVLAKFQNLKAVFSLGAGVDHIFDDNKIPEQLPVIKMVNEDLTKTMSEYIVLQCLLHLRRVPDMLKMQQKNIWAQFIAPKASDIFVGIMGMGVLGNDAASKLKNLGFNINCYSRKPKNIPGFNCYHQEQLKQFLQNTDMLIGLLPLTKQTKGIFNYQLFKQLRQSKNLHMPTFINAGRGALQVEKDIIKALDENILHAVSLDVFEQEPLPQNSELWKNKKVIITPHIAAITGEGFAAKYVIDMILQHKNGRKWQNAVDKSHGY